MVSLLRKHWPLIVVIGILWATIAILLILSIRQNQGHFVYALDDPYIHMAIAKNFVCHGVWGVNKGDFTSSSSSPLWTLLLSLIYFLFGINEVSPFILNFIFGTLLVLLVYFLLRKYAIRPLFTFATLLAITFFTPLPSLMFCGQEHIMHAFITILFVYLSAKILSDEEPTSKKYTLLLILAPLVTTARYEGLFLILVVSVLFILRRKLLHSLYLGGIGVLPIVIYGVISISKGWYFLPNPVLLKGNVPDISSLSSLSGIINFFWLLCLRAYNQMLFHSHMRFLILAALIVFIFQYSKQKRMWKDGEIMIIIFIATALLHMQFARIGWFFRYEAYLVALGVFVLSIGMRKYLPEKFPLMIRRSLMLKYVATALFILIVLPPLVKRGRNSLKWTPQATTNIYEQQYQMGSFLKEFYRGKSITANDIGAINYLADIECIDLCGLANLELAKLRREGRHGAQQIWSLAKQRNVKIAIVYDHAFQIPLQWDKVGKWKISNNIVCDGNTVSFYAVDSSETDNLIKNLKTFSSRLPKSVMQLGEYTNPI
jgi:hypothetical protein